MPNSSTALLPHISPQPDAKEAQAPSVLSGPLLRSLGVIPVPARRYSVNGAYWADAGKRHGSVQLSRCFEKHFASLGEGYATAGHLEVFELTRSGQDIANEVEDYLRSRTDVHIESQPSDLSYLLAEQFDLEGRLVLPLDNIGAIFFQRSLRTRELFEVAVKFPSWEAGRVEISASPLMHQAGMFGRATRLNGNHIDGRRFIVRTAP